MRVRVFAQAGEEAMTPRIPLKLLLYIGGALAVVAALWWLYSAITANPKAEARLSRNQAQAASQSGSAAVNTIGKAGEREAAAADLTRSNEASIRNAPGAADPVSAEARSAGISALCKRAAYKDDPRCVR
jgi:hypothetical protein